MGRCGDAAISGCDFSSENPPRGRKYDFTYSKIMSESLLRKSMRFAEKRQSYGRNDPYSTGTFGTQPQHAATCSK